MSTPLPPPQQQQQQTATTGTAADEHEWERMLQEAERLAAQMRAAAMKSNAHLDANAAASGTNASSTSPMIALETVNTGETGVGKNTDHVNNNNNKKPPRPSPPPPPRHPPRQASGSTIDTGAPMSTVHVPPQPPSVDEDALSLPSNIHIVQQQQQTEGGYYRPTNEMEAAIRATHKMEQALQALTGGGATTTTAVVVEEELSPVPTPAVPSPSAGSLEEDWPRQLQLHKIPPPPPPPGSTTQDSNLNASASSLVVPVEGDADYAPLKDYSFKPSKFTPDDAVVTWDTVDIAANDDDVVPLKDYSRIGATTKNKSSPRAFHSTTTTTTTTATGPGPLAWRSNTRRRKRRRQRRMVAVLVLLGLLGYGVYYYYYQQQYDLSSEPERVETITMPPPESELGSEPIMVQPLPWTKHNDMSPKDELDLEEAHKSYFFQTHPSEQQEDYEDKVEFMEFKPATTGRYSLPGAWVALQRQGEAAKLKDQVDALVQCMML